MQVQCCITVAHVQMCIDGSGVQKCNRCRVVKVEGEAGGESRCRGAGVQGCRGEAVKPGAVVQVQR